MFLLLFLQDLTEYLQSKSMKDSKETLEHIISLLVDLTRVEPSVVVEIETNETRFVLLTEPGSILSDSDYSTHERSLTAILS